jgi:hypothetical protein
VKRRVGWLAHGPVLAYAAGCMRRHSPSVARSTPTTWAWITEPWRSVFEVPPLDEGDEPEAVARARRARTSTEIPDATRR